MGIWFFFSGGFDFDKEVTAEFKERFNNYVRRESWDDPNAPYGSLCPWFIDDDNKMSITGTKFGEHGVWLEYVIEKFLKPEGYSLSGEIRCIVDGEYHYEYYTIIDDKFVWLGQKQPALPNLTKTPDSVC